MKYNLSHPLLTLVLPMVSLLMAFSPALAEESACSSFVLADASSGIVIESKDPDTARPPASMVKLMVSYSVLNQVKLGALKLEDPITVSATASKIGGSQVYLKEGEVFTVKDLLQAVLIQSANDGAYALAEHIGGSAPGFVDVMNEDAKKLGLMKSEFHSPHGLPPGDKQVLDMASANDFVVLSRALLKEFPQVLDDTKIKELPFRGGEFIMRNHNKLLFKDASVDGLKTGYYNKAGFNVTVTAERKGVRLIAVLMGCEKRTERDQLGQELLEKGFRKFTSKAYSAEELSNGLRVAVPNGKPNEVALRAKEGIKVSVLKERLSSISLEPLLCGNLSAPLNDNTPCGNMNIRDGEKVLASVPLYTVGEVQKGGVIAGIKSWWKGK